MFVGCRPCCWYGPKKECPGRGSPKAELGTLSCPACETVGVNDRDLHLISVQLPIPPEVLGPDWRNVFRLANEAGGPVPVLSAGGSGLERAPVARDPIYPWNVKRVHALENGQGDGDDWIGVFELFDGRFTVLRGGCDFSGWGCHGDHASAEVAASLPAVVLFGCTAPERRRLGLEGEDDYPRVVELMQSCLAWAHDEVGTFDWRAHPLRAVPARAAWSLQIVEKAYGRFLQRSRAEGLRVPPSDLYPRMARQAHELWGLDEDAAMEALNRCLARN